MSINNNYQPIPHPAGRKSYITTLLLAIFFGGLGAHRFYTGYTGIGIAQILLNILTVGIVGSLWAFIDLIAIALNKYLDAQKNELENHNAGCGLMVLILIAFNFVALGFLTFIALNSGT